MRHPARVLSPVLWVCLVSSPLAFSRESTVFSCEAARSSTLTLEDIPPETQTLVIDSSCEDSLVSIQLDPNAIVGTLFPSNLREIEFPSNGLRRLHTLAASGVNIEAVQLVGTYPALDTIAMQNTHLQDLDLSQGEFPALREVALDGSPLLSHVRFQGNYPRIQKIRITGEGENALQTMDISKAQFPALQELDLESPNLQPLDFSGTYKSLLDLKLSITHLDTVNFSQEKFPKLAILVLTRNQSAHVSLVGKYPALQVLFMSENQIQQLDLSGTTFPRLTQLYLDSNRLEQFHLTGDYPLLERLSLSHNRLTRMDLTASSLPSLRYLTLKSNPDLTEDQILYPADGCPVCMPR